MWIFFYNINLIDFTATHSISRKVSKARQEDLPRKAFLNKETILNNITRAMGVMVRWDPARMVITFQNM
jgi:hypothetical protein